MAQRIRIQRLIDDTIKWIIDRLERTPLLVFKFQVPRVFVNPFGFLGVLTAIAFLILGITGALLLLYYRPDIDSAFESVKEIQETIPFGFQMRQIHYHASNAMVVLAILHMFYQYFSGRYKIKNEVIWVTGMLFGIVTIIEAFTGYDLLFNQRALLAINIGAALTNSVPGMGPVLAPILIGGGYFDLVLRFYALHVFIFPMVMLLLVLVHFPRFLVFDIPVVAAVSGVILVAGGLFPAELGVRFSVTEALVDVPEWYFTALYALLRTGVDKFISGALLPLLYIIPFLVAPFIDKSRKLGWKERPFFTALGVTAISQIIVTTVWGFYTVPPGPGVSLFARLFIDPLTFYGALLLIAIVCFGVVYARWGKPPVRKPRAAQRPLMLSLPRNWVASVTMALVVLLGLLNISTYNAFLLGAQNVVLFDTGVILVVFAVIAHLYRYGKSLEKTTPAAAVA